MYTWSNLEDCPSAELTLAEFSKHLVGVFDWEDSIYRRSDLSHTVYTMLHIVAQSVHILGGSDLYTYSVYIVAKCAYIRRFLSVYIQCIHCSTKCGYIRRF